MTPTLCLTVVGLGAGDLRFDFLNQVGHACHLACDARVQKRASSAAKPACTLPS